MAAELVETSRLWARTVARIEPEWVEPLAGHLVKRSLQRAALGEEAGRGAVALEKVTLYGVPLVTDRKVPYGRIDPAAARELFIRHALVEGDWQTSHRFFAENRQLLAEAEEVEHRVRRRGLVVGEDELFAFYDARIPAEVVSAQHFDTWWKQARRADPEPAHASRPETCSARTPPRSAPTPTPTSGPRRPRGCRPCRCPTPSSRAARPTA